MVIAHDLEFISNFLFIGLGLNKSYLKVFMFEVLDKVFPISNTGSAQSKP